MSEQTLPSTNRNGREPFIQVFSARTSTAGETRCEQCSQTAGGASPKLKPVVGVPVSCIAQWIASASTGRLTNSNARELRPDSTKKTRFRPVAYHSRDKDRKRLVRDVLEDLKAWTDIHGREALIVAGWQALGLLNDVQARKSKALVIALNRTHSTNPATYYTQGSVRRPDCGAESHFRSARGKFRGANPFQFFKGQEKKDRDRGYIGAMLVICVEQAHNDDRHVIEAMNDSSTVSSFHALTVSKLAGDNIRGICGQLPERLWKAFLDDSRRGVIPKTPLQK
ncbi:hypothetical protein FB45DRAFT_1052493 [Roridomyces roridus]|uniref:Uncharacterized protein n=1 Tax=Roridomyces roridus TaxID=1738132 RepID=A0AAD7FWL9_9AGAR|nr:hypothetical protein FB45DRAFT_1052493 [Roridomyces roridus]